MQSISFVGKLYNKKATGSGDKMRLNFSLAVRKKYVSEADKKANKVNVFVPMVAFGKLAELIDEYIDEGRGVALSNCEYSTFEYEDDEGETKYGHNFKVGGMDFLPAGEDDAGSRKSSKKSGSKKRRSRDEDYDDDDEDEEEEERPRRRKKSSKPASKPAKKKRPVYDDDDDDFDDDEDDDDVPF